jgi:hypothetical protein
MQNVTAFIYALLIFPVVFSLTTLAAVSSGELYPTPTPIERSPVPEGHDKLFRMSPKEEASVIMKMMLANEMQRNGLVPSTRSVMDFPALSVLVRNVMNFKKVDGPAGFNHIVSVVLENERLIFDMKKMTAKPKSEQVHSGGKKIARAAKPVVHDGHFYKPFLQRPELFY